MLHAGELGTAREMKCDEMGYVKFIFQVHKELRSELCAAAPY